ncbi:MAG TPA: heparan-alpha-glucosaminide N-acetyltransferase domain-containing protein [Bryobacteraceae bacterium]|nr:heparan-alpha-glucosaminide N-acetyltransferase domain-containing protein [Bryobacteraceae bacterium]
MSSTKTATPDIGKRISQRVACIDWMRGFVIVLMVIDHAAMAFNHYHLDGDSAAYPDASVMDLPGDEFFTRWITHLCAPAFIFLAGTALALSVERKVMKRVDPWEIDKGILIRGAIIALLDPTLISLASGRWTFQVLLAIGVSMICMAPLRRLPTWALLTFSLGWIAFGEMVTGWFWTPPGNSSVLAAFTVATYGSASMNIKYPVLPWLAVMALGWVFGRHLIRYAAGQSPVSGRNVLWVSGTASLLIFAVVRGIGGYGDMFLRRSDNSWQQWLHVSKYPPSITYFSMELGILFLCLALARTLELRVRVRENGMLYAFGQTAMFCYLAHRLVFETLATYFGLRGFDSLAATYGAAAVMLALLYPGCLWYRRLKAAHPRSFLKYL